MHKPIQIKDLGLHLSHKVHFEGFRAEIPYGSRIGIIGPNSSGKSNLLRHIAGLIDPAVSVGYLPQIFEDQDILTKVLNKNHEVLLLDDPTSHLDASNRKFFQEKLQAFQGTLIIITQDKEILRRSINTLWTVDSEKIRLFKGNYEEYLRDKHIKSTPNIQEREVLLSISEGAIESQHQHSLLANINFSIYTHERIALMGDNQAGKSSFVKALMDSPEITRTGVWMLPKHEDIRYLDHLTAKQDFDQIVSNPPPLLILDEITHEHDLETRNHFVDLINAYPGALIVLSEDKDFMHAINIESWYHCHGRKLDLNNWSQV